MVTRWPLAGDSPLVQARRVAGMYRQALEQHLPEVCAQLDARAIALGQTWVSPRVLTHLPDEWLTAAQAADVGGVSVAAVAAWRRRGLIEGWQLGPRRWRYRAADVAVLSTAPRARGRRGQVDQ